MPAAKHYVVTETRKVSVRANTPTNAIIIAEAAFRNGQNSDNSVKDGPSDIWGNTTDRISVTDMSAREDF